MTQFELLTLGWQIGGYVVLAVVTIGAPALVKWLYAQSQLTVTDKRSAVLKLVGQVAVTAVTAAEQTIQANPDKKAAALKFVTDYLAEHNISLPVAQIDAAIESAVMTETAHTPPASPAPKP